MRRSAPLGRPDCRTDVPASPSPPRPTRKTDGRHQVWGRDCLLETGRVSRQPHQIVKWAVPLVARGQQLVAGAECRIPTMHGATCGLGDRFERHRRRAALTDQPSPGLDRAVGHGSPTWVDPAGPHGLVQCAPRRSRHLESVRPSRAPAGVQSPTRSRTGRAPLLAFPGCPWL